MSKKLSSPWIVLFVSVSFTILISVGFYFSINESNSILIRSENLEIIASVEERLTEYSMVLLGLKGLFAASENVTAEEWEKYGLSQNLEQTFPGIQGTGYIKYVQNEQEYADLIQLMNTSGYSNFDIHPAGERSKYFPVAFLHPLNIRNQQAIGYDIYSESTRATATDLAIQTNSPTITGKIILVQEIDENIQNGFLMLLPIYSNHDEEKLEGLVYTVFRMDDLMSGILDQSVFDSNLIKIYDSGKESPENILFDS